MAKEGSAEATIRDIKRKTQAKNHAGGVSSRHSMSLSAISVAPREECARARACSGGTPYGALYDLTFITVSTGKTG